MHCESIGLKVASQESEKQTECLLLGKQKNKAREGIIALLLFWKEGEMKEKSFHSLTAEADEPKSCSGMPG